MLRIGIDTGGTCTDAVIYDTECDKVIAAAKSATTHRDLKIGIRGALEKLPEDLRSQAECVALSTTLATNACVEGKGARAGLILIGAYRKVVIDSGYDYGLPPVKDICMIDGMPGDELNIYTQEFRDELISKFSDVDSIAIAQRYPDRDAGAQEKEVAAVVQQVLNKPCVLSSELFPELDIMKRGSGSMLNARLIPIMAEFLGAVESVMEELGIKAKVWIVRSDGTLMSGEFAGKHPVETLLCGPAASIIAGRHACDSPDALIVDMGGTTTDISIVRGGYPLPAVDGITIGNWKTLVKGVYISTFGLGGDSRVVRDGLGIRTDVRRVVPLCALAKDHPQVMDYLSVLSESEPYDLPIHEFFILLHEPDSGSKYEEQEMTAVEALRNGPLSLRQLAEAINTHVDSLPVKRLENEGIILRSGLTPTDIMHITGRFTDFEGRASEYAAKWLAKCLKMTVQELCDMVDSCMVKKLYCSLVHILLETDKGISSVLKKGNTIDALTDLAYKTVASDGGEGFKFSTRATLVGVGAPTRFYIQRVAEMLGTVSLTPEYAATANALGAAVSDISIELCLEVRNEAGRYVLKGEGIEPLVFDDQDMEIAKENAIEAGEQIIRRMAEDSARKRGALGGLNIEVETKPVTMLVRFGDTYGEQLYKYEIKASAQVDMK